MSMLKTATTKTTMTVARKNPILLSKNSALIRRYFFCFYMTLLVVPNRANATDY